MIASDMLRRFVIDRMLTIARPKKSPQHQSSESTSEELSVGDLSRRILTVEDSPVVATFATTALEEFGCVVIGPA